MYRNSNYSYMPEFLRHIVNDNQAINGLSTCGEGGRGKGSTKSILGP